MKKNEEICGYTDNTPILSLLPEGSPVPFPEPGLSPRLLPEGPGELF